jgi:hypothetical protein
MNQEPDSLQIRLARLASEIPPERDLWAAIEARLGGRRPRWHFGLGIAAGLAILALSLIVSFEPHRPTPTPAPTLTAHLPSGASAGSPQPASNRPADAAGTGHAARAASYEHTRETLERDFQSELARLPNATRARLRDDLDVIRKARGDIRTALAANPDSPLLQALLADTWQQEMDFYADVSSTPDAAGMRWPL